MRIEHVIKEKRQQILQIARQHGAENLRLFGSFVHGDAGESSDVDLLVEVTRDPSPWFPAGLVADLEELLGRRVHIITEGALHPYIRDRVTQEAVPL